MAENQQPAQEEQEGVIHITAEFRELVKKYIQADDDEVVLKNRLKEVRANKRDYEEQIHAFMQQHKLPELQTRNNGTILLRKRTTRGSLNKGLLAECLSKCGALKDGTQAEDVVSYIYNNRPSAEKTILERK